MLVVSLVQKSTNNTCILSSNKSNIYKTKMKVMVLSFHLLHIASQKIMFLVFFCLVRCKNLFLQKKKQRGKKLRTMVLCCAKMYFCTARRFYKNAMFLLLIALCAIVFCTYVFFALQKKKYKQNVQHHILLFSTQKTNTIKAV